MKPPKRVKVGPHTYEVLCDRASIDRESARDGEKKLGCCDTQHCRIVIEPDQADSQLADTVVHELLHASFDLLGVQEDPGFDDDVEERLVRRLAPVLVGLLVDNPRLVAWLTGRG